MSNVNYNLNIMCTCMCVYMGGMNQKKLGEIFYTC